MLSLHLITGGAGFIATNLAGTLLETGHTVVLADDLSLGSEANVASLGNADGRLRFARVDCTDVDAFRAAIRSAASGEELSDVWHLAANSDIAAGSEDLQVDVRQTFLSTIGVAQLMSGYPSATLHFASTSAVYGNHGGCEVAEDSGPFEPISYYGAMKLASEALIRAAVERFVPRANILRFANVIGAPSTHGVIHDFISRLLARSDRLVVKGDGTQRKPYLHVSELVEAMIFIAANAKDRFNVYNIGPADEGVEVADIAGMAVAAVAPGAVIEYGIGRRGWVGDVPQFRFSVAKLAALGWSQRLTSSQAVRRAMDEIVQDLRVRPCRP